MPWIVYIYFSLAIVFLWLGWIKLKPSLKIPWAVFISSYLITTVIGGIVIGLDDGLEILLQSNPTLNVNFVRNGFDNTYWFLLFSPLVLVTWLLLIIKNFRFCLLDVSKNFLQVKKNEASIFVASVTLSVCIAVYLIGILVYHGFTFNIVSVFSGSYDYESLILLRTQMMEQIRGRGILYYEMSYVGLPTLSWVALFKCFNGGGKKWYFLYGFQVVAISFFLLSSVQKAPIIIYVIGVVIAIIYLGKLNFFRAIVFSVVGVGGLTIMQFYYQDDWTLLDSISHLVFRVSSGFVFYTSIYPEFEPWQSIAYGFGLFGIGVTMEDNQVVFDYMYRDVAWVQGAAAAASHLRAYTQGGVIWAMAVQVMISIFITFVGRLHKFIYNPIAFAILVQSCLSLYYLTQTSLRGAFLESYGLIWGVDIIVLLIFLIGILNKSLLAYRSR